MHWCTRGKLAITIAVDQCKYVTNLLRCVTAVVVRGLPSSSRTRCRDYLAVCKTLASHRLGFGTS